MQLFQFLLDGSCHFDRIAPRLFADGDTDSWLAIIARSRGDILYRIFDFTNLPEINRRIIPHSHDSRIKLFHRRKMTRCAYGKLLRIRF